MDTFTCSSWYYLRYTDPHNTERPFGKDKVDAFMPVDQYIGGIEHAILHLLYSRFFTKVLRDMDMLSFDEHFTNLLCQGMVLDEHGDVMSKSKGNVVSPESMIARYGADSVRACILFMAPPDKELLWNEKGLAGINKFLYRAWRAVCDLAGAAGRDTLFEEGAKGDAAQAAKTLLRERHRVVAKVEEDFGRNQFNTAISAIMELVNTAGSYLRLVSLDARRADAALAEQDREVAETIVKLLAPIAPHWAEELWHEVLGEEGSVCLAAWPGFDEALIQEDEVERAVMIKGKVRAKITTPADASEEEVVKAALEAVADKIEGLTVRKTIVAGNVVNVVAG